KLLDFGIARVLSDDGEADLTRTGQRVLTPSYAAPEQVRGEAPTTATDVYALGGLLYRLLCGARPIETDGRTPVEIEQAVLAETPRRPSDRVTPEAAVARSAPEAALARRLRGDLDTITLTALEKDPERRYGSAAELLADVERHLGGLPIDARPASRGYRARLFVRRHRLGVAGTAAALAAIGIVAGIAFARVSAERDLAAAEARRSEEVVGFLQTMLRSASPYEEPGEELTARELLDRGAEQIGTDLADEPATQAALQVLIADVYLDLFRSEDAVPLYREALATRRRLGLGIEAANTARQLGRALRDLEQYEEAEPLLRSALAELEALDADPNTIAFTRRHLASLLRDRGDFETSEAMYRQALAMAERQPEPDEELIEDILNSLAIVLRAQDKDPESVVILGQLVDRARSASPERPYSLATSLTMYSRSLSDIGRGEEGIAMAREAAALFREIHADTTHPDVATSIQGIGRALEANGDLEAADRAYTEAVARLRAALGDTDLRPLAIMNAQATLKDRIGRPDEAAELYREVIANTDLYPGRQAITLSLFADSRARQGDVPEAMRAFRRSAAHFRAEGDAEGLDDIITDFAEALREGGQDDLADEVLRERPASE
ncbi:MAG: tetratricopeptide repeat-containing protein kinase family protein, partial [Bacteroidota bacterium]